MRLINQSSNRIAICALMILAFVGLQPNAAALECTWCNADIGGTVYSTKHYYGTSRTIVYPPSLGSDIAALKYVGPTSMKLGAHNCAGSDLASAPTISSSTYTGLVGHKTTISGQSFCLFTQPGGGGSTGTFTANLDWD